MELSYGQYEFSGYLVFVLGSLTAGLTAFYSIRLICLTFFGTPNGPRVDYEHTHEQSAIVVFVYVLLGILSICSGYVGSDLFVGMGSDMLSTALFTHPDHNVLVEAHYSLPLTVKLLPTILTILGTVMALALYLKYPAVSLMITNTRLGKILYQFFNAK